MERIGYKVSLFFLYWTTSLCFTQYDFKYSQIFNHFQRGKSYDKTHQIWAVCGYHTYCKCSLFQIQQQLGHGIVLIGLVIDFCLYTYSLRLSSDVDTDITEDKRFKGSLVAYVIALVVILTFMLS